MRRWRSGRAKRHRKEPRPAFRDAGLARAHASDHVSRRDSTAAREQINQTLHHRAWSLTRRGHDLGMRPRVTHSVLVLLCRMYFITYLDRVNVSTAAAGFGKEFGLSHTEVGLVFSAFAYPYLIFQI